MTPERTPTQGGITAEEALTQCLDEMESGSRLPVKEGLRKKIGDDARKKFEENHYLWDTFKDKVVRSARQIGTFAEEFARFDAEIHGRYATEVMEGHADEAIRVVKRLCPAGLKDGAKFRWCPGT